MKHQLTGIHYVSRETSSALDELIAREEERFNQYTELLLWWNKKINLVSRNAGISEVGRHIRHSLIPVALDMSVSKETILDTGTGGGLPGIPLAMALPERHFILNDISEKKCRALKQMVHKLGLVNCEVRPGDLEKLRLVDSCILATKHAFKLKELFHKSKSIPWKQAIIYKGKDYQMELDYYEGEELSGQAFDLSALDPPEFFSQKYILLVQRTGVIITRAGT
ncbi:MAG: RsmG family class I SAM-dependent methyltransferase [Balneolales bacterium]